MISFCFGRVFLDGVYEKLREMAKRKRLITIKVSGKNSWRVKLSFKSFRLFLVLADFKRLARCSLSFDD